MAGVRRSTRANKGRNERLESEKAESERLYQEQLALERNNDKYIIKPEEVLCTICGTTDENFDEDDERDMVQCDSCQSWQHNECILQDEKKVPDIHLCNICDPNNSYYKSLQYELDPAPYIAQRKLQKKSKDKKRKVAKSPSNNNNEDDDDGEFEQGEEESDDDDNKDASISDHEEEKNEEVDDKDFNLSVRKRKRESVSESTSSSSSNSRTRTNSITPKSERKPRVQKRTSSTSSINSDDINEKARLAVTKRFEGLFDNLLKGKKIPNETDSTEEIAKIWAKKLESELFDCYHDRETMKLGKDYKEVSTRIFVNVRDIKNIKLRNSIINKSIPFHKLVRMPVNELLNPDLKKEKEEAIKESTTLATLEKAEVSNIRRTHKGDIVLEKEDATGSQQFDFNVGVSLDNDEKRFSKDEKIIDNSEHKNSIYSKINNDINNSNFQGDAEDYSYNDDFDNNNLNVDDEKEDEDLAAILGDNNNNNNKDVDSKSKPKEGNGDAYDPTSTLSSQSKIEPLWEGQTIFTGFTNFDSSLNLSAKTLTEKEYSIISNHLIDPNLPLMVEGRLDAKKADSYIKQVSSSRRLVLFELKSLGNEKNFNKLFEYFETKQKFGVVPHKSPVIKDIYLFSLYKKQPGFLSLFRNLKIDLSTKRLFVIFIVKQESIRELRNSERNTSADSYDPTIDYSNTTIQSTSATNIFPAGFEFLAQLNPNELQLVNNIFESNPQTKNDPNLLIQVLQEALTNNQKY